MAHDDFVASCYEHTGPSLFGAPIKFWAWLRAYLMRTNLWDDLVDAYIKEESGGKKSV